MKCRIISKDGSERSFDNETFKFLGRSISLPKAKTNYIEIPLADGKKDVSFHPVRFEMREITIKLELMAPRTEWNHHIRELSTFLYVDTVDIEFSDSEGAMWHGRASITSLTDNNSTATVVLKAVVEPFTKELMQTKTVTFDSTKTYTIHGAAAGQPRIYYEFINNNDVYNFTTIEYNGETYKLTDKPVIITIMADSTYMPFEITVRTSAQSNTLTQKTYRGNL